MYRGWYLGWCIWGVYHLIYMYYTSTHAVCTRNACLSCDAMCVTRVICGCAVYVRCAYVVFGVYLGIPGTPLDTRFWTPILTLLSVHTWFLCGLYGVLNLYFHL